MKNVLKVIGILLFAAAIICFALCIFRKSDRARVFLPLGLMFNSIAFFIYIIVARMS